MTSLVDAEKELAEFCKSLGIKHAKRVTIDWGAGQKPTISVVYYDRDCIHKALELVKRFEVRETHISRCERGGC